MEPVHVCLLLMKSDVVQYVKVAECSWTRDSDEVQTEHAPYHCKYKEVDSDKQGKHAPSF
jgi:hypothetical protein